MKKPTVSVIMPVYNGEKYLKKAIESILNQTFYDFEFIIIDDCSIDYSEKIIKGYDDSRIVLVKNEKNLGITKSLNIGLDIAKGKYIARMDCDDISMLDRLKKQVDFLDANHEIDIVGSWVRTIGDAGGDEWRYPADSQKIKVDLLFFSCFVHPTVMFRKRGDIFRYDEKFVNAQDYDLWVRVIDSCNFTNLQEILLEYRVGVGNVNKLKNSNADKIRHRLLKKIDCDISKREIGIHNKIAKNEIIKNQTEYQGAVRWLIKLIEINKKKNFFKQVCLEEVVVYYWIVISFQNNFLYNLRQKAFWHFLYLIMFNKKKILFELIVNRFR